MDVHHGNARTRPPARPPISRLFRPRAVASCCIDVARTNSTHFLMVCLHHSSTAVETSISRQQQRRPRRRHTNSIAKTGAWSTDSKRDTPPATHPHQDSITKGTPLHHHPTPTITDNNQLATTLSNDRRRGTDEPARTRQNSSLPHLPVPKDDKQRPKVYKAKKNFPRLSYWRCCYRPTAPVTIINHNTGTPGGC